MLAIINYIKKLKGQDSDAVLNALNSATDLSVDEKNLVYLYLFPRPLMDKELQSRILSVRKDPKGSAKISPIETTLIIEASQTEQYNRFIKHLFYSFKDPNNIFPIEGSNIGNCCLCGKEVYEEILWKSFSKQYGDEEITNKVFQAYGSVESDLPICLPCLLNLRHAIQIMEEIDPYFIIQKTPIG